MSDTPGRRLAHALQESTDLAERTVTGLGPVEADRALFFVQSAYDLALEMCFQKGDPGAPQLTNWERPWRKFGGDNPTTTYLSAPVSARCRYRLTGDVGDAVYAGVQVYTRGPGYNAPSANISDVRLIDEHGGIDLLIGGADPGDGAPWLPLLSDDYLVMLRLYRTRPTQDDPDIRIERIDGSASTPQSMTERADRAEAFFRDEIASTISVTEVLRASGVNAYPPADAEVHQPRYTGALFPTLDNVYDGFFVDLQPGQSLRLHGQGPTARFWSLVFYDRWFNTPDFSVHRCYLTGDDVVMEPDGSYQVVLGPEHSDHPNWIDTAGLRQGILALRCLLPQIRRLPAVTVVD
ncbi:MAG: DUF1214 domain-containing protein [Mycobacterium sp.]